MTDVSSTSCIMPGQGSDHRSLASVDSCEPTKSDLIYLLVGAALLRALLALVVAHQLHKPVWFISYLGDGGSYLRYAKFLAGLASHVNHFDFRVFPGFPLLIAGFLKLGANPEYTSLALSWLSAGVAALGAALLYNDRRVGIAVALLLPEYLICTTHAQSEGPMLALGLVGLMLARRNWSLLGGIILGLAGTMRPVICFAVLGFALAAILSKNWRSALVVCAASLAIILLTLIGMHYFFGDAFQGMRIYANDSRAYGGKLLMWPGESLLMTPLRYGPVPKLKIAYVWVHAIFVAVGCVLIVWRCRSKAMSLDILSAVWLVGNSLFALCVGGIWGFEIYPRLQAPGEPALFWAYRRWLPRRAIWWILIGVASFAQAVINMDHK